MTFDLSPFDDPIIECHVRLWQGESVSVFVHPNEWKKVAMRMGMPMLITSCDVTFPCCVMSCGEHFQIGMPKNIHPKAFGVPTHGDYAGTARIDWSLAVPDLLREGLENSPDLRLAWRSLSCEEMRAQITFIRRAQRPGVIAERQLALLRSLQERRI